MQDIEKFKADVTALCNLHYELDDGKIVRGRSVSNLRQYLSCKGWRGISGRRIEKPLEEAGFKISMGRGRRYYHGGKQGLGVPCEVVHLKAETCA